jgi:hypothetical protein
VTDQPRPEPLAYLILAGVAVDVTGAAGFLTEALVQPVVLVGESAGWWLDTLSTLGAMQLPIAVATVLLMAYLVHQYRSEVPR